MVSGVFWCLLVASVVSLTGASLAAEDLAWPCRTGPTLNGHAAAAEAEGLPTEWNEERDQNLRWKVAIEHPGHSTPVIGNGRVWITSATHEGHRQFVHCFDADTGAVIHDRLMFENADPEPLNNEINTYASPSCALRDDAVFVHFGSYGTARLDPQTAETVWERRDIECRHYRGPGSSPILFEDLLLLTFDGVDQQFLMALDTDTGATVWRTDRTTDYGDLDENGEPLREGDLRKAYGTPGLVTVDGRTQVVSIGSRAAFGYDARTGKELWTIRHDDFNSSAPPSFFGRLAILNTGSRAANLLAVRLEESTRGDVTDSHVVWNRDRGNSDLAAPLVIGERVFMITNTGVGTCLNVRTGEEIWKGRIDGTYTASPVTANGLIYFCNEEGVTSVVKAADDFVIIARNALEEGMRASPAVAGGCLYLRTFGHLYCIGQDDSAR